MKVCITGSIEPLTRTMVKNDLKKMGCTVVGSVTSSLDVLVAGDKPGSKLTKAKDLGIRVVHSRQEVKRLLEQYQHAHNDELWLVNGEIHSWSEYQKSGWKYSQLLDEGVRVRERTFSLPERPADYVSPSEYQKQILELQADLLKTQADLGLTRAALQEKEAEFERVREKLKKHLNFLSIVQQEDI